MAPTRPHRRKQVWYIARQNYKHEKRRALYRESRPAGITRVLPGHGINACSIVLVLVLPCIIHAFLARNIGQTTLFIEASCFVGTAAFPAFLANLFEKNKRYKR